MENKKAIRVASISSIVGGLPILLMGLRAVTKYCSSPKDWHYVAGFIGSILIGSLMLLSIVALIMTFIFPKRK